MKNASSEKLLRVEEAAERLGLRVSTIRRYIIERRIDYVKLNRAVRIPLETVEKMIQAGYRPAINPGGDRRSTSDTGEE